MPTKPFTESPSCDSRGHCGPCRDKEGGRAFRASLAVAFSLPAGAPDFECPHGLNWGDPPPVVVRVKRFAPVEQESYRARSAQLGRDRWDAWHRRCLTWDGSDPEGLARERSELADGMPGCSCRDRWRERCARVPFVATNAEEAFSLSVDDHNDVSRPLGKRHDWTVDEARALYASP